MIPALTSFVTNFFQLHNSPPSPTHPFNHEILKMTTKPRPEPLVPSNLPTFISSDLGITSWSPLDHGGHNFVLKITTSPSATFATPTTSVLKIFRFHLAARGDSPTAAAPASPYH